MWQSMQQIIETPKLTGLLFLPQGQEEARTLKPRGVLSTDHEIPSYRVNKLAQSQLTKCCLVANFLRRWTRWWLYNFKLWSYKQANNRRVMQTVGSRGAGAVPPSSPAQDADWSSQYLPPRVMVVTLGIFFLFFSDECFLSVHYWKAA